MGVRGWKSTKAHFLCPSHRYDSLKSGLFQQSTRQCSCGQDRKSGPSSHEAYADSDPSARPPRVERSWVWSRVLSILNPPTALPPLRSSAACARASFRSLRFVGDFQLVTPTKDPCVRRPIFVPKAFVLTCLVCSVSSVLFPSFDFICLVPFALFFFCSLGSVRSGSHVVLGVHGDYSLAPTSCNEAAAYKGGTGHPPKDRFPKLRATPPPIRWSNSTKNVDPGATHPVLAAENSVFESYRYGRLFGPTPDSCVFAGFPFSLGHFSRSWP